MSYLRSFAPWIVFAAVSAVDWRYAALAGLLAAFVLILRSNRRGLPLAALVLEISTVAFFAVLAVVGFADRRSPVGHWAAPASLVWIALTAWGSLAVGSPFTLGIARQSAPRQYWDNPIFRRVNVVLTAVWAATFSLAAAASAVVTFTHAGSVATAAVFLLYAVPIVVTRRYPAAVRARYAAGGS